MKTEHERLKEIMDLIGYEEHYGRKIHLGNDGYLYCRSEKYATDVIDIEKEEIIYNSKFWKALKKCYYEDMLGEGDIWEYMEENLDKPVEYLYNTLGLGTSEDK